MKYTREILQEAVDNSTSMAGVMRYLGVARPSGGLHAHLRRRIDQFGIDTAHFRRVHNKGGRSPHRMRPSAILIERPDGSKREKPELLRRALRESGHSYACAACGMHDVWQGRPITLHVDHINGNILDCRIHNLRFLCPNCHSQTATFAGRSKNTWRSRQEEAAIMARNRLIVETALKKPTMGVINLVKLHPELASMCSSGTVRRVLERVELESADARREAAKASILADCGTVKPWAAPTVLVLRTRLTEVLKARMTAEHGESAAEPLTS